MPDNIQGIQDAGSLGEGEGEPTGSLSAIEAFMDDQIAGLATFITDPGDIPADATERQNGHFSNDWDLREYLEEGALVAYDENGDPVPFPWVYAIKEVDADTGDIDYVVYIRETSE